MEKHDRIYQLGILQSHLINVIGRWEEDTGLRVRTITMGRTIDGVPVVGVSAQESEAQSPPGPGQTK